MHRSSALVFLLAITPAASAAHTKNILITGYWPPSNEAVRPFSNNPVLNPNGWIGENWENRGYNIYAYFPTFTVPTCTNCGAGMGDLMVDYQDTSTDFWPIANGLQPVAVMTFSRSSTLLDWVCEVNQYNRASWAGDYIAPTQPTPSPPDASVPAGFLRLTMLPVEEIAAAVGAANLGVNPVIDWEGDAGGFVSEFIAYHGVWYQSIHAAEDDPAHCAAAGHIHVGRNIPWVTAHEAAKVSLRELLDYVDSVLGGPGDVNVDGDVNVEDLLAVIGSWGACPSPPFACPGDIAPEPDGDGEVNVIDLLAVISFWGT